MNDRSRAGVLKLDQILIIDPIPANAKMLANLLRGINPSANIQFAQAAPMALALARETNPKLIFVEAPTPALDGLQFTRDLRRSNMACREAPIIMISSEATAAVILAARDAGVHEFLRRPYNTGDVLKRLDAVAGKPRDWVEAIQYIGPDRRRFNSADYNGKRKRRSDGPIKIQKINQALKIVAAAAAAVETDPVQARRALAAQARILIDTSAGMEPLAKLRAMARALETYLTAPLVEQEGLSKVQVDLYTGPLIALAPPDPQQKAA